MTTAPKLYLLDAGPVIELHRIGRWSQVVSRCDVIVPQYIAETETRFFRTADRSVHTIDLGSEIAKGRIAAPDVDAPRLQQILERFDYATRDGIDTGEAHALALLDAAVQDEPSPAFCSGDQLAVIAACLLGFHQQIVSLESLLGAVGLTAEVQPQYTTEVLDRWLAEGRRRSVTREGLL